VAVGAGSFPQSGGRSARWARLRSVTPTILWVTDRLPHDRRRSFVPARSCRRLRGSLRAASSAVPRAVRHGWDPAVAGLQVWPYAQPAMAGLRCQGNKVSRAPAGVVPFQAGRAPAWEGSDASAEGQADRRRMRPRMVGCLPAARTVGAKRLQALRRPRVAAPGPRGADARGQPAPGDREPGALRPATRAIQAGDALVRALLARSLPAAGDAGGPAGRRGARHRASAGRVRVPRGRPRVVFALPQMGNYDLAGAWLIAKGQGPLPPWRSG
jgi:hypothetical protein